MMRASKAFWLGLIVVSALAFGTDARAQANLLANPGFEANGGSYTGWQTFGSGPQISTPATDNIFRSGTAAAKIYGEFTGCPSSPQFTVGGAYQAFTPTPGLVYEFSGYSFVSSADTIPGSDTCLGNRLIAKIVFLNAGGGEISSNEVVIGDWSTPREEWVHFSVSAPAPATAVTVQPMLLFLQPACDEGSVFVDDVSFFGTTPPTEPNVLVNPSFDTSLLGWTTFGNVYYDGRTWARRTPSGGAKMYGTFVQGSDSGMFQEFAAAPGSIWKLDSHVMSTCVESPIKPGNGNMVVARLLFKDGSGGETGAVDAVILDGNGPLGTWTKHTVMGVAPAGTASVAAYLLFVQAIPTDQGAACVDDISLYDVSTVGVPEGDLASAALHQNVPNPFNPTTRIAFELPLSGDAEIVVYNLAGREVRTLFKGELPAGPHTVVWDGRTNDGSPVASGTYWYQLRTPDGHTSKSMVLLK